MMLRFFFIIIFSLINLSVFALSQETILKSSAQFYPDILIQEQRIKKAETDVQQAQGVFDTRFSHDAYTRSRGFYDGQLYDTSIRQPLADYNAEIYSGYRVADGIFPIYEDEFVTNNGGEYYIGAKLSLMQNRDIDKRRTKIRNAFLKQDQAELKKLQTLLKVQESALKILLVMGHEGAHILSL